MCRYLLYSWLVLGLLVMPVLAQTLYEVPEPQKMAEQSLLWEWLFGLTFLVGCLVVGFKPAKRSNLK
jgi:hypothetical protein